MYELSANDQSVVTGPNTSYEKLNINRNQQQQYNKGQEPGVPVERPQRQVGRQGRGKQAEQTQNYNQPTREQQSGNLVVPPVNIPKYQPRQTEAPKAPRSPNDVTTPGYPTQNINTQGRHHDYDSRSLHVNDRSPTSENVPYDRYRDGGSPSSPYGRTYQDYSPRDRAADSAPYDRYRDEHSAPHYHQIDPVIRTRTTRADHTLQKVPPMIGIGVTAHHHPLMDHVTTRGTFLMRNRHVIDTALPILPPLHTERNPQGGEKETHKIGTVMSPRPITGGLTLPIGTIQADRRM